MLVLGICHKLWFSNVRILTFKFQNDRFPTKFLKKSYSLKYIIELKRFIFTRYSLDRN